MLPYPLEVAILSVLITTEALTAMAMDREAILEKLSDTEKHIGEGERQLRLQRELIGELHDAGSDATEAEALLKSGEQIQKMHFAHRSRLLRELSTSNGLSPPRYVGVARFWSP